jgi:hypothetical protein
MTNTLANQFNLKTGISLVLHYVAWMKNFLTRFMSENAIRSKRQSLYVIFSLLNFNINPEF